MAQRGVFIVESHETAAYFSLRYVSAHAQPLQAVFYVVAYLARRLVVSVVGELWRRADRVLRTDQRRD
jgi:hypothetical protein